MVLFFPESHYDPTDRGAVFPLLKAFIKGEGFSDSRRKQIYSVSEKDFRFTQKLETADFAVLTMSWNYYVKNNREDLAKTWIEECRKLGKKVLIWNAGDYGVKIPFFENGMVFRESGSRSRFLPDEFVMPVFIADPLQEFYQTKSPFIKNYRPEPEIGFCGQAVLSKRKAAAELGRIVFHNLKSKLGFSPYQTRDLLSSTYLRAKILKDFQNSDHVKSRFILRDQYRAGVVENKNQHPTTREFYENMKNSAYAVCVRGKGNFSVRFYEALAMGRIPVLFDTGSVLPLENHVNWNDHILKIDQKNSRFSAEILKDFHRKLSAEDFEEIQIKNRKLWEEKLTLGGFFKEILKTIKTHHS